MRKKLLSLALTLAMMCCIIPVSAAAANPVTISENGISVTFSDVVSYEDVTICLPYLDNEEGEDFYETETIRIYHLPKNASIVFQNVSKIMPSGADDYNTVGAIWELYSLKANYVFGTGKSAPYPVLWQHWVDEDGNIADDSDDGSLEGLWIELGEDGDGLNVGESSDKIRLNVPSEFGKLVCIQPWRSLCQQGARSWEHMKYVYCAYDNGEYSFTDNAVKKPAQPGTPASTAAGGFTDVNASDYFAAPVLWAVEKGITSGTSKTTFSPGATCSKAQILTFLWRANGSPEPKAKNPFSDIKTGDYFYKAALWAAEKGMVSGSAFGANTPCTRATTMEYMWKAAGSPVASNKTGFTDVPANADYAQAVAWAVEKNVTSGTSASTFSPSSTCTRGQIVTFLYRAFGQ